VAEQFPLTTVPPQVAEIAKKLLDAGYEAWYVGGAVRDTLMSQGGHKGRPYGVVRDFDIATSARPEQVQVLFKRTVPVGIEHGTVAVLDADNKGHEVTTFRRDVKTDGRHADVEFGVSLDDDLARRDFTINALAVHPASGELRDPFKGQADLDAGLMRAVGDAATRFREDRLRVLRGLRFAAVFGFTFEPATRAALEGSVGELGHLSRERVRDEWTKMLGATASPAAAVRLWRDAKALTAVWPELAALPDEFVGDVDAVAGDPVLITAALLVRAGVTPKAAAEAAARLKFSGNENDRIRGIVAALGSHLPQPTDARAVRRWMSANRAIAADAAMVAMGPASARDALVAAVTAQETAGVPLAVGDLALSGQDLMDAGVPAGPQMGKLLRLLLDVVLDDPSLNRRETLLARLPGPPEVR
jgi:tRNA nucleotidyltransferase (CCA-adding enzyme)